ncbi:hypothetical protein M3Y95_01111700 [Aphelenchoides besseyi]|nr:hypothetical protein M3Y95_01111700 [Aphelenchoides besseyi]
MNEENTTTLIFCDIAHRLHHIPSVVTVVFLHFVTSFASFFAFWRFIRLETIRKSMSIIGSNLKLVIYIGSFYYLIGICEAFLLFSYKLNDVQFLSFAVDFNVVAAVKMLVRLELYAYTIFHGLLLVERLLATFVHDHFLSTFIVRLGAAFLLIYPAFYLYYFSYLHYTPIDRAYCHSGTRITGAVSSFAFFKTNLLLSIDILSTIGDGGLMLFNRRQISQHNTSLNRYRAYHLNNKFHLREMELTIRIILPFSLCHSIVYLIQQVLYALFLHYAPYSSIESEVFWRECVNWVRTLSILGLAISQYLYHNQTKAVNQEWLQKNDTSDMQFELFRRMISK